MTHQEKINSAASLIELAQTLNSISAELTESESITDTVRICDLPIFGGRVPDNTTEVWSWDEHSVLVEGNNGAWVIEPRCKCGEATFHCHCGA